MTFLDTEVFILIQDGVVWPLDRNPVTVPRTDGTASVGYEILDHSSPNLAHVVLEDRAGVEYGQVLTKWVPREKLGRVEE